MKAFRLFLLAVLACVSFVAQGRGGPVFAVPEADRSRADLATLVVPVSLDVEMIDGIDYPEVHSGFRKGDIEVRILPGTREIAVKYNQLFQINADNHEIVKSKIIVLSFVAEAGKVYRATHEKFRNVDAARAGVKNFVVKVEDAQGANQVVQASQVQKNWKGEVTSTTRKDLVSETAVAAAPAAAIVAPVLGAPPVPGAVGAVAAPTAAPAGGVNALELLKFTWQSAAPADRAAFLEWAKANP